MKKKNISFSTLALAVLHIHMQYCNTLFMSSFLCELNRTLIFLSD